MTRLPNLPDEWWGARWLFKQLRAETHRRGFGADAVLGAVLVGIAAHMPHHVRIDTGLGVALTPSLFGVLAGSSGTGKTTAVGLARTLVPPPPKADGTKSEPIPLGSGEGIVESYMGKVAVTREQEPKADGTPRAAKVVWERRRVRSNALLLVDEGEKLFREAERAGSMTGSVLRSVWSGATAGQANADADRTRVLEAGTYNCGLLVGLQSDLADGLLSDIATGMAQRFLWFTTSDVHVRDDVPAFLASAPMFPLTWVPPLRPEEIDSAQKFMQGDQPPEPVAMRLAPDIAAGLRSAQIARVRGDLPTDSRDAQRPAMHCKVAAVLSWLDGRLDIGGEDWALAGVLLDTSDAVRDALVEHTEELAARSRAAKGTERAAVKAAEDRAGGQRAAVGGRVLELLGEAARQGEPGLTRARLTTAFGAGRRALLPDVLAELIEVGHVEAEGVASGGTQYRLKRKE